MELSCLVRPSANRHRAGAPSVRSNPDGGALNLHWGISLDRARAAARARYYYTTIRINYYSCLNYSCI